MSTEQIQEPNLEAFTPEVVEHLRTHKDDITPELLDKLRSCGNEGKHLALEILDIDKDEEEFYVDAFSNKLSFNGNRRLKKEFSKLDLSPIHVHELRRCAEDLNYFKDNYVKIRTKTGVNFPDLRDYQNRVLGTILKNESIVSLAPRQSGKSVTTGIYLSWKYNFSSGLNIGIVANKGSLAREFLSNVKNILIDLPIWMQQGTKIWNKGTIENENKMRILTDVPGSDAFRGFVCHILVVDEAAWINTNRWDEFTDSIFPSQSSLSWKKNILLSTANGQNHFCDIVEGALDDSSNGYTPANVDWREVPRFNKDGTRMSNEEFQDKIVKKHGVVHFNQNYGCEFLGSSYTLISSDGMKRMKTAQVEEVRDGKLRVYKHPEPGHKYIMSVDASKDGEDAFAVQVVDITDFKFEQVASADIQIDYLLMPEFLNEWCEWYNFPYLIIENNEGAGQSCADVMYQTYEYENLHFDKTQGKKKKYPGFRTTAKTRKQILLTMKLFIENSKLTVVDSRTIKEFQRFILINKKYQADNGAHDDMVMSLAMVFAPFCNMKNFEDMKKLVDNLYADEPNEQTLSFSDLLTVGSFDSGTDEDYEEMSHADEFADFNNELGIW